jgi:hypothetical protein
VCAELETAADRARKLEEAEASSEEEAPPAAKVGRKGTKAATPKPGRGAGNSKKKKDHDNARIQVSMLLVAACVSVLCLSWMPHASPHIVMSATMISCAPLATDTNAS